MDNLNSNDIIKSIELIADKLHAARKEIIEAANICSKIGFNTALDELNKTAEDLELSTQKIHKWINET